MQNILILFAVLGVIFVAIFKSLGIRKEHDLISDEGFYKGSAEILNSRLK